MPTCIKCQKLLSEDESTSVSFVSVARICGPCDHQYELWRRKTKEHAKYTRTYYLLSRYEHGGDIPCSLDQIIKENEEALAAMVTVAWKYFHPEDHPKSALAENLGIED